MRDDKAESSSSSPSLEDTVTGVTPDRWRKIKELLLAAEQADPTSRDEFLRKACGADEALYAEIKSLLEAASSEVDSGFSTANLVRLVGVSAAAADPMIGRRIGSYEIVRPIGQGGMAVVYLAVRADDAYHKQVAVKLVRSGLDNAEVLSRFRKERQTLASLDHPNIVRLIDGGRTPEGVPYLVMDVVEGLPIDEYCDSLRLSVEQRLRLFHSVCGAVHYAHQHLVVHRDLKPSNILITSDGVPKLLDFGIAKVFAPDSSEQVQSLTLTGARRMTPAYASPEQVRGQAITPASDIYSLGVVLYELLTRRRPYPIEQMTPLELEKAICEQEPENPSTVVGRLGGATSWDGINDPEKLRRRLRGDLDRIILTALKKEPSGRYATLEQFASDIQMHLEHRPVKARGRTVGYRTSKFVRRRKNELLTATLVLLVLLGASAYTMWQQHQATARAQAELAKQQLRGRRSVAVLGFKSLASRPDMAWMSTALAEMLTTDLAAGGTLRAVDDERVAQAKLELSLPESDSLSKPALGALYKYLGCDYVIVGSYDANDAGHDVRLNLRLQDAGAGETLASLTEAGTETGLADLARRAGAKLRVSLGVPAISASDLANVQASMPTNPESARLYAEGLARLRAYDALGARGPLERAVASAPDFALGHLMLSEDWTALGYDAKARQESKLAMDLSSNLSRESRLLAEARYREANHEWGRAAQIYGALFEFFPDNVDYALKYLSVRKALGVLSEEDFHTIDALHDLPSPVGDDPRIDLLEHEFRGFDSMRAKAALARALERAASSGAVGVMAQGRLQEGKWLKSAGNLAAALSSTQAARDLFDKAGNQNGVAQALSSLGEIYLYQGDRSNSKTMYQKALTIYRAIGNQRGIGDALSSLGYILGFQGDWTAAENMFRESLDVNREIQFKRGLADTLNYYGTTLEGEGHLRESRTAFEQARALYIEIENSSGSDLVTARMGQLFLVEGDLSRSERSCVEALRTLRYMNDKIFLGRALSTLGNARMAMDKLPEAIKAQQEAEEVRRRIGASEDDGQSQLSLASMAILEGRFRDAGSLANQARANFHRYNASVLESYAQAILAESLAGQGELEKAHELIRGVVPWSSTPAYLEIRLPFAITIARVLAASSRYTAAREVAESRHILSVALQDATTHGYLGYQLEARLALAEIGMKTGDNFRLPDQLAVLEQEARSQGFLLIARKAAEARAKLNS